MTTELKKEIYSSSFLPLLLLGILIIFKSLGVGSSILTNSAVEGMFAILFLILIFFLSILLGGHLLIPF